MTPTRLLAAAASLRSGRVSPAALDAAASVFEQIAEDYADNRPSWPGTGYLLARFVAVVEAETVEVAW